MEYTQNSDLAEMGIDEFAHLKEKKAEKKPKKAKKEEKEEKKED